MERPSPRRRLEGGAAEGNGSKCQCPPVTIGLATNLAEGAARSRDATRAPPITVPKGDQEKWNSIRFDIELLFEPGVGSIGRDGEA